MYPRSLSISSVGQITLPKSIRELLGVKPGDKLEVVVNKKDNSVTLGRQKTFDEVMAEMARIRSKYPNRVDPKAKNMSVGEISLEQMKKLKGEVWV